MEKRKKIENDVMTEMRKEYGDKLAKIEATMSKSPNKGRLTVETPTDGKGKPGSKTPAAKSKKDKPEKGKGGKNAQALKPSQSEENLKKFRRDPTTLVKTEIAKDQYEDKLDERRAEEKFQTWLRHQEVAGTGFKYRVEDRLRGAEKPKAKNAEESPDPKKKGAKAKSKTKTSKEIEEAKSSL